MKTDPDLEAIRQHPEFRELMEGVKPVVPSVK